MEVARKYSAHLNKMGNKELLLLFSTNEKELETHEDHFKRDMNS
jgi:hypothetical protein